MDLLFHLVFPLHCSRSVEELSTPSSHPQPVGFQCWIPSSRDQTCSGVIYFSKYRYQLKGIHCLCCTAEELGSVCSPGRAAHDPGEGSSEGSHSRRAWPRSVPVFARLMWGRALVPAVILGWMLGAARPRKPREAGTGLFLPGTEHSPVEKVNVNSSRAAVTPPGLNLEQCWGTGVVLHQHNQNQNSAHKYFVLGCRKKKKQCL